MKIGLIAPIWYPIPPVGYGGIELIVSLLADQLVDDGHDVTLFASGVSKTKAKLVSSFEIAPSEQIGQVYPDLVHVVEAYLHAGEFDIINDHSGSIGPSLGAFSDTPVLHTLHGPATKESKRLYELLSPKIYFNSISDYQRTCFGDINIISTIYNAIDLGQYSYSDKKGDYLLFVGRMSPEKGAHLAVEVANRLNEKLVLVTKMVEPPEIEYFEKQVKPLIGDNTKVLGQIDVPTKVELYKNAKCTLFPIEWPEPFGLVMIESMATGTPVIAFENGAVTEVMNNGENGFIVHSIEQMIEKVPFVHEIEPSECRRYVEDKFSVNTMVGAYEKTYEKIIDHKAQKKIIRKAV